MAQDRYAGLTNVGDRHQRFCAFGVITAAGSASGYRFLAPNGNELYMWLQDDGAFYGGTRAQFEAQSGGQMIGGTGTISATTFTSPNGTVLYLWLQDDGRLYIGTQAQFLAQDGGFSLW